MDSIPARQLRLRQELEARGLTDRRVLDTIQSTRRDLFVPPEIRAHAYDDDALGIGSGQTISQPYIVALMTQSLELTGTERVLEVGTGSGYQCAILARLCAHVVTVERLPELAHQARLLLTELGYDNIEFEVGDGTLGWAAGAPYDGILVTAAAPDIPGRLYDQLSPGGRLVIPVGNESQQELQLVEKTPSGPRVSDLCGCRFVKLIGAEGWSAD
jgi:protein-L-isoaspartate(D-aspartate) O-methyltransferase